jgi:hypothetical protein
MEDIPAVTVGSDRCNLERRYGYPDRCLQFWFSAGETLNINVQGITPSGYNGVFTGAVVTGTNTLTYTVANSGSSGGAGTALIKPSRC